MQHPTFLVYMSWGKRKRNVEKSAVKPEFSGLTKGYFKAFHFNFLKILFYFMYLLDRYENTYTVLYYLHVICNINNYSYVYISEVISTDQSKSSALFGILIMSFVLRQ